MVEKGMFVAEPDTAPALQACGSAADQAQVEVAVPKAQVKGEVTLVDAQAGLDRSPPGTDWTR